MASHGKILSLILCSRNDNYMGNSLWRLQTTLNITAQNAVAAGIADQIEILVADWGSERWLSQDLHLTPEAAAITSFIQFPAEVAAEAQKDSPFSEVHPLNAAARVATGEFIGRIDQDTIVGEKFFARLPALVSDQAGFDGSAKTNLFFSQRRDIHTVSVSHSPSANRVVRLLEHFGDRLRICSHLLPGTDRYWTTGVGIWLLHRDLWHECRGYNETYIYRNEMEVEMANRLMQKYPMNNLGPYMNYSFYHLGHERVVEGAQGRKVQPMPNHTPDVTGNLAVNDANWGMPDHPIQPIQISPSKVKETTLSNSSGSTTSALKLPWDIIATIIPILIYVFKRATLISLLTEGHGFATWRAAFGLRYRPRNLKRHLSQIKRKAAHKTN